jgi:hypothetical protein
VNPDSTFNKRLKTGDLFGEYGHPFVPNLSSKEGMQRVITLEAKKKAVFYRKIYSKRIEDLGIDFVFGDLKPAGPYGKYAEEALLDPNMNFSTSLRAITDNVIRNGIVFKKVFMLITFDVGVPGGGYKESSKRYSDVSQESINEILDASVFLDLKQNTSIAFESLITKSELNDILKYSRINIKGRISGYFIDDERLIFDETNNKKRSILSALL